MRLILNIKSNLSFSVFDSEINDEVGNVELIFIESTYWLSQISVHTEYLDKDYGKEIIRFLKLKYKPFKVSLSDRSEHNKNASANFIDSRYLTLDGVHLMKSCFEKAILSRSDFAYPFPKKSTELTGELDFLNNF